MAGDSYGYYEDDHGKRTYDDGKREWRERRSGGWTRWTDSDGNSGWERDDGNGWTKRQTDDGDVSWGKDEGGGHTYWDDGTWTKKR